jgi:hypothetical protein
MKTRIDRPGAGREDDRSDIDGSNLFLLAEIDCPGRAELLAGSTFPFFKVDTMGAVNGVFQGNGLWILHIGRFAGVQSLIKGIFHLSRTFLGANPTRNTLIHINVAWELPQRYRKTSRFPLQIFYLRQGMKLNIQVPADLDQFG